jgi:hypothetical protein
MCPLCLTALAVNVATATGAGAAVAALAVRIHRSVRKTNERLPEATKGTTL